MSLQIDRRFWAPQYRARRIVTDGRAAREVPVVFPLRDKAGHRPIEAAS